MRRPLPLLLLLGVLVPPSAKATTVYLPAPGAQTTYTITGATTATPIVLTVSGSAPANGTALWVYNVGGQKCADGFWITAGASGSTFQLAYMYFGGNAVGNVANCTGTYTSGGTAVVLTGYTLTAHPRVFLDGPSGTLETAVFNTCSTCQANTNNPPWSEMNTTYNALVSAPYTTDDVDSGQTLPFYFKRFAAACFEWAATGNGTASTVCDYGIDHFEQIMGPSDNFGCGGGNGTDCNAIKSWDFLDTSEQDIFQAYSVYHGQLTGSEITAFSAKVLNSNSYTTNGLGLAGAPTSSCTNNNSTTWTTGNCGLTWAQQNYSYAPCMAPGQESHYNSDFPLSTAAGTGTPCPISGFIPQFNLTLTKLMGYMLQGLALADDDPRAQMLVTQAGTFFYEWYMPYAQSTWSGFNSGASRYECFRVTPFASQLVLALKQSGGPNYDQGSWLFPTIAYSENIVFPDFNTTSGPTDSWATQNGSCNGPMDILTQPEVSMYLYSGNAILPYMNYFLQNAFSQELATAHNYDDQGSPYYTIWPWLFQPPTQTQTNPSGNQPTQYVFNGNAYSTCSAVWGSSDNFPGYGCFTNANGAFSGPSATQISEDHAFSRSGWGTTDSYVFQRAGWVVANIDHYCEAQNNGCDAVSLHIYRRGFLLTPTNSGGVPYGSPGGCADNTLCVADSSANFLQSTTAPISRWASTNPTGDSQSRYAYWMVNASNIFTSGSNITRANRHVVHLKKASTQDYVIVYDDMASGTSEHLGAYWFYQGAPTTATGSAKYSNGTGSISASYFPVTGTQAQVAQTDGLEICGGSGTACSNTTTLETISVYEPSTSSTAPTLPTISQPTCTGTGGNCTVADIQDSTYPKVAVFARQGALLTAISFTSTHSGTAQYLVAGLSPATYTITAPSASPSSCVVNSSDNTCYFEATAGAISLAQGGGAPPPSASAGHVLWAGGRP